MILARIISALAAGGLLAACNAPEPERAVPEESLTQLPAQKTIPDLTGAAEATRFELMSARKPLSLRILRDIAADTPGFVSSPTNEDNRTYWNLLRRTGLEPTFLLSDILEEEHGETTIDGKRVFVWPDLAALPSEDLIPEKLSFRDRARLKALVGEDGIARIRAGEPYPGIHTAIDEDGLWLYFIIGVSNEEPEQ